MRQLEIFCGSSGPKMTRSDWVKVIDKYSPKRRSNAPWWYWCVANWELYGMSTAEQPGRLILWSKPTRKGKNPRVLIVPFSTWKEAVDITLDFFGKDHGDTLAELANKKGGQA